MIHLCSSGRAGAMLALFAAVVVTSGCQTYREYVQNGFKVGPNYCRPAADVAEHWIDASDKRLRSDAADHEEWWNTFHDPVLSRLVQHAFEENLTLRQAGFRVMEAQAARQIAAGNLFPQAQSLDGSYSRQQASLKATGAPILTNTSTWTTDFNLAWELDFWGRFRRAVEAADADLDTSVENYDDALVTLIAETATAYVEIRTFQRRLTLLRENVDLQKKTLDIADARFKNGATTVIDVAQARADLAQTESNVATVEIALRQANNRLCVLLGEPPHDLTAELGEAGIPAPPAEVGVGMPAELLNRRPDVRRAEREAAAASARVGVAMTELYPHISVTGTLGWQAHQFKDVFNTDAVFGSVGPSFRWNILNYGRIRSAIRVEDARFEQAVLAYQATVLRAGQEAEDGIVSFLQSQRRAKLLGASVAASQEAIKVAQDNYREGRVPFVTLANLQQNLVLQQDAYTQAQGNVSLALISVFRALGGGWEIRLAQAEESATMVLPDGAPMPPVGDPMPQPKPAPLPDAAPNPPLK